jgi:DNA-binding CsgD family transcriptional regulator/tetratricopeptide (TPR) repeat protein
MLVGREVERRELDSLLSSAREEQSAVLVLRGEPGIGKTALLEYAAAEAVDMRVLRCVGIEAEHELPFAGIHQLVRPCLDLVDRLPAPQAAALQAALGLSPEGVQDRFLVSLGLLSLLAEACEDGPLLCCVDDAQWLDGPSAEALLFAARRFVAEPIAVLICVREGELRGFDAPGVPSLELGTLDETAAEALLKSRLEAGASHDVLATLLESARGNPLALLELPAGLSSAQLAGAEPILGPPPVRPVVEESFRARVEALPESTRGVLLLAAADEAGDVPAIQRAAGTLGLGAEDLDAAEQDGLVRLDGTVTFRHPLVRSAIYRSAGRAERKAAHEALAAAVDDPARSAWHRALVADRADEGVASELEAAGAQAAARGAQSTASAAFERAAALSEDDGRRGHRLAEAAQAAYEAGRLDAAMGLVERAQTFITDPVDAAQLKLLQAGEAGRRGSPAQSRVRFLEAGALVSEVAPERASELLIWAVLSALQAGRVDLAVAEVEPAIDALDSPGHVGSFGRALIRGAAATLEGDSVRAGERFARAIETGRGFEGSPLEILNSFAYAFVGDFARSCDASVNTLALHRRNGSLAWTSGMFPLIGLGQLYTGRLRDVQTTVSEGVDIARRLGYENDETGLLALHARAAAARGREQESREAAETALRRSLATDLDYAREQARLALGELELGFGNLREALEHLEQLSPVPLIPVAQMATPDIVDAALRLGEPERARSALERLATWAPVSDAPVIGGMLSRCCAMLSEDSSEAEALFVDACEKHALDAPPVERARSQLAYGEWLRRERRRTDARTQLRNALDTFEGLGMVTWAERARGELTATGETARKRDVSTLDDLTPQELRIARLVAAGGTNRDVAAELFVSPKTVEYHLRKVFMKLGVSSRVELARVPLDDEGPD